MGEGEPPKVGAPQVGATHLSLIWNFRTDTAGKNKVKKGKGRFASLNACVGAGFSGAGGTLSR